MIISKHIAANAGVFDLFVQGGKGAALVLSHVISMSPIPGTSIIGDVGLYLLGAQSGNELMVAIALGVVPGGVIVKKFIGPMKNMLLRTVSQSVQYLTRLAMNHAGIMKKLGGGAVAAGGRALGWLGMAIQNAARKVARTRGGRRCGCFTAATLVMTANGAVPIVDIEEGQQVLAAPDDGLSESYSSSTVGTKIVVGEANLVQLIVLHEDGSSEIINTTDEHPFHVADTAQWTRADGLVIGDHLSTIAGKSELVGVVYTTDRVPVYNLSIPGTPTYYVGEHGVWVHNCAVGDVFPSYSEARNYTEGLGGAIHAHHIIPVAWLDRFENLRHLRGRGHDMPAMIVDGQWHLDTAHPEILDPIMNSLPANASLSKIRSELLSVYSGNEAARSAVLEWLR